MRALFVKNVSISFSSGTTLATAQANIIHSVPVPVYVGAFVADTLQELDDIRAYVNSHDSAAIYQNGNPTATYDLAKAALPWLWEAPIYVRSDQGSNVAEVATQEATERVFPNMQQIWLPQEHITKVAMTAKNGVIAVMGLPNLGSVGGFSIDGGATWAGSLNNIGLVGGYDNRTNIPVYAPDLSKYFNIQIQNSWSNATNPNLYSIKIGRSNSSYIATYAAAVNAMRTLFELGDIPTGGGDPYDELPIGGSDPIPGGDSIPEPGFPSLSAASTGIVGLFCPSVAQMQQLADFMWTDFGGTGTTVEDILEEVVEALKRSISNPLDYIFGLNMIPSQGLNVGASKVVKFGFVSSGVSMPILADHYFRVDCGSLSFDTLCGNSFLDYAPYSKFSIYLPYIGFKDVDPNDFVGHTISVAYHGDAITGGLTAYIFKDGNVMYQYSGGCALNIPLSSDNWGATIAAAAGVATGVLSAAAVPGAAGVAGAGKALLKGAASNVASNPSLLSPQVMHSGAVTGSPGFMGVQYPFIIREAVNFHSTEGFNKSSGYPAYYYRKLGDVAGYTTVMDAHMANIPMATQEEIEEIENLLESGVIL